MLRFRHIGFALALGLLACGPADDDGSLDGNAAAGDIQADAPAANGAPQNPTNEGGDDAEPQPGPELITPDGWGPLRIGMTLDEVVAAAGEDANPEAVGGPEPEACDEFRPADAPEGILVMIERGVLTRISVNENNGVATAAGIRVGAPADRVLQAYGDRVTLEPHKYVEPPAAYLTVWREGGERRGIRYEVGPEGTVTHIRGGGESIEYVEGCL